MEKNFDLRTPHLRRAVVTKHAAQGEPAPAAGEELPVAEERILPHVTMSTFALVILASKWAANSQKKRKEITVAALRAFVAGLVDSWVKPALPVDLPLGLDLACPRRPGVWAPARVAILLHISAEGHVACDEVCFLFLGRA